ncbi:DUF397 domain-containing protein [Streptomyces uncialis]|uniref:DUF397 domain-containing protein n=1 Tax=Streptomyces uncialis TaxID=1048205 RepID=UPI003410483D
MSQESMGWVKSSYSSGQANCVEVRVRAEVAMRDSKWRGAGPHVGMSREGWQLFVTGLQHGNLPS